ncbi:MAG: DOMON-like domain-containing protein [Pseudomonadota bacterium]|nr:DOMON-like domain-containing protein [Pseudomonadota bacterium]
MNLLPHPATPPSGPLQVWANVDHAASFGAMGTANIWFGVRAPADRFVIPALTDQDRVDDLWHTTCFEAFLRSADGEAYREWNFAPSTQWAVYDFDRYREGMECPDIAQPPYIRVEDNLTWWTFGATIAVEANVQWQLGLSAVLEEKNGTKSYWALAHPEDKPDFHHPDCFVARLP